METKNPNNATLLIVAVTILLIVAMVCGVVIWMAQRTFALNEKLLDARLAQTAEPQDTEPPAPEAAPKAEPKPEAAKPQAPQTQAPKAEAPKPQPQAKPQAKAPAPEAKPEAKPAQAPAQKPAKRKAPTETPEAKGKIGPDGLPLNRVTLPVGNDELEWQL